MQQILFQKDHFTKSELQKWKVNGENTRGQTVKYYKLCAEKMTFRGQTVKNTTNSVQER